MHGERLQLRPIQNNLLDILEFVVNPGILGVAFYVTPLFIWTKGLLSTFMWLPFIFLPLIALLPLSHLIFMSYFKRKTEKTLVIELSEKFVSYFGDIPFMKGLTIPLQDILSVKRYANPWQKMFGLGNIELEIRNGVTFTNDGPLFYIVIPSIRESEKVEKLLKEKCNFLKR